MYLSGHVLREKIGALLSEFDEEKVNNIAYDISPEKFIVRGDNGKSVEKSILDLAPNQVAFVQSKEVLHLPDDVFASIIPRNSALRIGLEISAPTYQPGHKTKIFFRVKNLSDDVITLEYGASVCSVMFYKLDEPVDNPYNGSFSEEMTFSGTGRFHETPIPEVQELDKKIDSIKHIESGIYSTVVTILTVFVSIFSIVNLNASYLPRCETVLDLVAFNLVMLGAVFSLVGLIIGVVTPKISGNVIL